MAWLDDFNRRGIAIIPDVVPSATRAAMAQEYEVLLRDLAASWGLEWRGFWDTLRAAHLAGHDWFQPMDISLPGARIAPDTPFHAGPAAFDLLTCPQILDVVEQIIGPEITSTPIQHLRIKPPAKQVAQDEARVHVTGTMWHQDRGVAHAEADQTDMVTVWVAMTDATIDNGCLVAQPFDGPQDMLPHCPLSQTAIPAEYLDKDRAEPLEVRAGGIVLLHPMVPHASLDNRTDGFRWSFDLRYQKTGQPTGRAHFPDFVVRSQADPSTELRDADTWRQLWLDARAACAVRDHIPIHRWTSSSPHCA